MYLWDPRQRGSRCFQVRSARYVCTFITYPTSIRSCLYVHTYVTPVFALSMQVCKCIRMYRHMRAPTGRQPLPVRPGAVTPIPSTIQLNAMPSHRIHPSALELWPSIGRGTGHEETRAQRAAFATTLPYHLKTRNACSPRPPLSILLLPGHHRGRIRASFAFSLSWVLFLFLVWSHWSP